MSQNILPSSIVQLGLRLSHVLRYKQSKWWENDRFSQILIGYASILGLLFTFWIPPFSKPDEIAHFYRSVSITQGQLVCAERDGVLHMQLPQSLLEYPVKVIAQKESYRNQGIQSQFTEQGALQQLQVACTLPFLVYIPTSIVIAPLVWFNLDPEIIFYVGRLSNLALGLFILVLALMRTPAKLRLLPASVFLLPMTWHQLSAYNKEHIHIAFALLAFSFIWSFLERGKNSVKISEVIWFVFSLILSIIARPQYAPLMLLIYLIPREYLKKRFGLWSRLKSFFGYREFNLIHFGVAGAALLLLVLGVSLQMNLYTVPAEKLGKVANYEVADADKQLEFLSQHPAAWVAVPYYTFLHRGSFLFDSMIGTLGSFDVFLDWYVYTAISIMLGLIVYFSSNHTGWLRLWQLVILTGVIAGCLIALLMAMYLYSTKVGEYLVTGLQGRYFIVLLPLTLWLLSELRQRGKQWFDYTILVVLLVSIIKLTVAYY